MSWLGWACQNLPVWSRKSEKSDFLIFVLGKFVWGAGWWPGGANAVYVAFAMLCVHLGLFQPPKAAGILGVGMCDRLVKKKEMGNVFLWGSSHGVADYITHENIGSLYSAPGGVITVVGLWAPGLLV